MKKLLFLLKNNNFYQFQKEIIKEHPKDIALFFKEVDNNSLLKLFKLLPKDIASDVFSYLSSEKQKELAEKITDKEISDILQNMFLDDTVDFIEEMPSEIVNKILRNSSEKSRSLINQFLNYPEDSAGSIMTSEYVSLKGSMKVFEALNYIRTLKNIKNETMDYFYIVSSTGKLNGILSIKDLIMNQGDEIIKNIMVKDIKYVTTFDDQEEVASKFRNYDFTSMPVVDKDHRLVGIITIDDIVDIIDKENTEDLQKMAAMSPSDKEYLNESVFSLAKHRIIWLLVLMISATATGIIIRKYEEVLQSVVILAAFIPMLMDTGGNAGSQSSTLIIRGMALGEITLSDSLKVLWKEFRVSLIVGITLGGLNFIRLVAIDKISYSLAFVVCSSLFATVVIAKIVGGVLPIGAKSLKLDPAIMASPLITTIVDACALIIYFKLATELLNLR
nr:magnesium transporter [uncultured Cetobacterium sp.]